MIGLPEFPHVESVGRKSGIVGIAALGSFLVRESLKRFVTQGTQKVRKLLASETEVQTSSAFPASGNHDDGQPKKEA